MHDDLTIPAFLDRRITKLYVKSMDGTRWYVGSEPCEPHRGSGFQLGSYYYGATDGDANNNLMRARSYARSLVVGGGYEIADYGMNEPFNNSDYINMHFERD